MALQAAIRRYVRFALEGGTSVNSIAHMAWREVDLRSEGAGELARIDIDLEQAVQAALEGENNFWPSDQKLTAEVQRIGVRDLYTMLAMLEPPT